MNKATNLGLSLVLAGAALQSARALAPLPGKTPAEASRKLAQSELGGIIQRAEIRRLRISQS